MTRLNQIFYYIQFCIFDRYPSIWNYRYFLFFCMCAFSMMEWHMSFTKMSSKIIVFFHESTPITFRVLYTLCYLVVNTLLYLNIATCRLICLTVYHPIMKKFVECLQTFLDNRKNARIRICHKKVFFVIFDSCQLSKHIYQLSI